VTHAGGVLLVETARRSGLAGQLTRLLGAWRKPLAVHDPGKIRTDLAIVVALGRDAAADIAVLRAQPGVFGPVASDPTVSRLVTTLAGDADQALAAIATARAAARARVWRYAGAPVQDGRVTIDMDAILVPAHSEKQDATRTWKRTFGFHPLLAFADHGTGGGGEPLAEVLRPGRAGSNTAADHVTMFDAALAQLPAPLRARDETGRVAVLVRTDAAGATKDFAAHLTDAGVEFSVGASLGNFDIHTALAALPKTVWTAAYQARKPRAAEHGIQIEPRDGDPLPVDVDRIAPGSFVGDVVLRTEITPFLRAAQDKDCIVQVESDMLFEMVPAYLEFFGFGGAVPDELRALAQLP
jgi:hypothetical protein